MKNGFPFGVRRLTAATTSSSSSSNSNPTPTKNDPYDSYRRGVVTAELWQELQAENQATRASLNRALVRQLYQEIDQAATAAASDPHCGSAAGPTGLYLYEWITRSEASTSGTSITNRRIYQRRYVGPNVSSSNKETQRQPQGVLEVEPPWNVEAMSLSVDENLLVYILVKDDDRNAKSQIWVCDIENGSRFRLEGLPHQERAISVEFGSFWESKSGGERVHSLFYVTVDSKGRPYQVYGFTIDPRAIFDSAFSCSTATSMNQPLSPPTRLVYQSNDPKIHVDVQRTKGGRFVALNCRTQSSNEVYLLNHANNCNAIPLLVQRRENGIQYYVDAGSDNDVFVLIGRQEDAELQLLECSVCDLPLSDTLLNQYLSSSPYSPTPSHVISDFDIFENFVVLYEQSQVDGIQQMRVVKRHVVDEMWNIELQQKRGAVTMLSPGGNMHYGSKVTLFHIESPAVPRRTLEYNMDTRVFHHSPVDPQFVDDSDFVQRRVLVSSMDGTQVPLSIIHRSDGDGISNIQSELVNVLLIGYGAYGQTTNLAFDPALTPLFDRGFVLAFAHTRGGGDLGRRWHVQGRGRNKPRGIEDFLACAEALESGTVLSRRANLMTKGFSAGGVLVAAAVNQRPDLFRRVVLTNAFLDVDATLRNPSLHLTEHEWDEFGNPVVDAESAKTLAMLCPTLNAQGDGNIGKAPKFLVIGTLDDDRVPFWNTVIYAKKKRGNCDQNTSGVFLHVESAGGHHLGGNRIKIAAMEATFLVQNSIESDGTTDLSSTSSFYLS